MQASTRSGIVPKYWSSSSWPFGGLAPNSVRPVLIRSGRVEEVLLVDQEVLLLGADGGEDLLGLARRRTAAGPIAELRERVHRAQQRGLLVERLAGPGDEGGRDEERVAVRVLEDVGGAGRVPGGVAAGLEGGADAAGGERGGVGLALDQLLAGEARRSPCRRRRARRSSRASRRSSRSAAGTGGCSGWRRSPAPSPSSPRRRRRRGSGRAPRRRPASPAASRRRRRAAVRAARSTEKTLAPNGFVLGKGQVERAEGLPVGAPLRCGHVLLADTSHRLVVPHLAARPLPGAID